MALLLALRATEARDLDQRLLRESAALVAAVEDAMTADLRTLEMLAGSEALRRRDLAAFREEANRLRGREAAWQRITLVEDGRPVVILPSSITASPVEVLLDVQPAIRNGRPAARELEDGRILLSVPAPREGSRPAVLLAMLESATMAATMTRFSLPEGWSGLLMDAHGRRLAGTGPDLLRELVTLAMRSPDRPQELGTIGRGVARLMEATGWMLVLVAPPRRGTLPELGLAGALLATLLGAAFGSAVQRRAGPVVDASPAAPQPGGTAMPRPDPPRLPGALSRTIGAALPVPAATAAPPMGGTEAPIVLEPTDCDPAALLKELAAAWRPRAAAQGIHLRLELDRSLPERTRVDPDRLRQIVTTLLANAVDASQHGEITLLARLMPTLPRLEIAVADTGQGIPPEGLQRIFDRFGEHPAAGTMLDLGMGRRLALAMEGAISVEVQGMEGCRLVLRLPHRPGAGPVPVRAAGSLRLLVAEDTPAARLLLKALLERAGHVVTTAEDGAEALAALHHEAHDVALLDLQMPGVDGLATAAAIRRMPGEAGRMPLVALTADPAEDIEDACRAVGFDAVLRKPADSRRLLGVIESLAARRRPLAMHQGTSAG